LKHQHGAAELRTVSEKLEGEGRRNLRSKRQRHAQRPSEHPPQAGDAQRGDGSCRLPTRGKNWKTNLVRHVRHANVEVGQLHFEEIAVDDLKLVSVLTAQKQQRQRSTHREQSVSNNDGATAAH
jgi:hypothetical protein